MLTINQFHYHANAGIYCGPECEVGYLGVQDFPKKILLSLISLISAF